MSALPSKIRFVVATREDRHGFFTRTLMGKFLTYYKRSFIELDLYESNKDGLATVYNKSIKKSKNDPAILIFAHDDILITDFFWPDQLIRALQIFDIVGVAGNKRRLPNQPAWAFIDKDLTWDASSNLSGIVGHGHTYPPMNLSVYGPTCQRVQLLDGLFLASQSNVLIENDLYFDERFDFHFYDLDFCRQVSESCLKMGTWCISVIHQSGGNFRSPAWQAALNKYLDKWGE